MDNLWSFIKAYWKLLVFFTFIITSLGRIGLISESRQDVRELFSLREEESRLLKESTSLSLESNVLTRHSRLRKYADNRLDMGKPKIVRKLEISDNLN